MSSAVQGCPDKFYKYKPLCTTLDLERVYNTVMKGEIYYPAAHLLNDPFELHPVFSLDAPAEKHREDFLRLSRKFEPALSDAEREAEADRVMCSSMAADSIRTTTAAIQALHATFLTQSIGVLCLTTEPDNLLMWSHYGDSHRGICLEFDGHSAPMTQAQQVAYTVERLPINPYVDTQEEMMIKGLLTKSEHWRYEEEWRICRYAEGPGLVALPVAGVTGVIVGALAPRSTVEFALKLARERSEPLAVHRMIISPSKFGLEKKALRN